MVKKTNITRKERGSTLPKRMMRNKSLLKIQKVTMSLMKMKMTQFIKIIVIRTLSRKSVLKMNKPAVRLMSKILVRLNKCIHLSREVDNSNIISKMMKNKRRRSMVKMKKT